LIKEADVIKLYLPFPNISEKLAKYRHMYAVENNRYSLFVIQTAKPYLVRNKILKNYITLDCGDDSPVKHRSYLGMDLRFIIENIKISEQAKTKVGLSKLILRKIRSQAKFVAQEIAINQADVINLNETITVLDK